MSLERLAARPAAPGGGPLTRAFGYAAHIHGGHARLAHPLAVSTLVLEYGGDEEQAAAAMLHEVIRVAGPRHASPINRQFGARVLRMVLDCGVPRAARADGLARHLAESAADSLLVTACDVLHEVRCLLDELQQRHAPGHLGNDGAALLDHYHALGELLTQRGVPVAPVLREALAELKERLAA
ncbi:MAG TPA: HD domain-containing protein [Pseudomonas sp.]|nr:HD domain-containing protein [Pseudomonas sp.]